MNQKALPKFFVFDWESACIISSLPISLILFTTTPLLDKSDLLTLFICQINLFSLIAILSMKIKGAKKVFIGAPLLFLLLFNYEHILVNESNLNFNFFHLGKSKTFRDSIFNISYLFHALYLITCLMISMIASHYLKIKKKIIIAIFFFSLVFQFLVPVTPLRPNWVRKNFLVENVLAFFNETNENKSSSVVFKTPRFESGQDILPLERENPKNIILIILEGFSQYHVEAGYLPKLKKLQKDSFYLKNFLSHQKQTNRGLFSILCGDYPSLKEFKAKSDQIIAGNLLPICLPKKLEEMGYKNTFIQSAPLEFMGKDRFAKKVGFNYAIGANSFQKEKIISSWGVADEDIFSASLELLSRSNEKQFLTLLTANTHHPYKTSKGTLSFKDAIQHIDNVVVSYIEELKRRNLLKNSLVIITSDEAFQSDKGLPLHFDNWGLLMAFSPHIPTREINTTFGQRHIQNSILHFLGLENKSRSFFKRYDHFEANFFSNIFQRRLFLQSSNQNLVICTFDKECEKKKLSKNLFSFFESSMPLSKEEVNGIFNYILEKDSIHLNADSLLFLKDLIIQPKEKKLIISEFKLFSPRKTLKLERDNQDFNLLIQTYICGRPNSMKTWNIKNDFLELPDSHIGKNLCLSLFVENSLDQINHIRKIKILNE